MPAGELLHMLSFSNQQVIGKQWLATELSVCSENGPASHGLSGKYRPLNWTRIRTFMQAFLKLSYTLTFVIPGN